MSPNSISHSLSSYQKSPEQKTLYLGDMDESDAPDVQHNKNDDKLQKFSNGDGSDDDPERSKFQSLLFLAIILSLAIGWSASKTLMVGNSHVMIHNSNSDNSFDDDVVLTDKNIGFIPNVIWRDEFDGDELDLDKWTFVNGNGCDVGLCGWGKSKN